MAVDLSEAGVLEKYGVELLGSSLHAIKHAEDRELFKRAMNEIHQPVPESGIFDELEPAVTFADKIGYPVIIRPAYTLGAQAAVSLMTAMKWRKFPIVVLNYPLLIRFW